MNAQLITRILLATDFSYCAIRAQEYATHLAKAWDASMDILQVLDSPVGMQTNTTAIPSLQQDATWPLHEMQQQIMRDGVAATVRQLRGARSEQINLATEEHDVDLVVLGTRGQSCLDHMQFGSTVDRVTKTALCPVLVVRGVHEGATQHSITVPSPISFQHILVPVDFSSTSLASLQYAIQFAKRLGAKLTLLHALEPVYHDLELGLGQIQQEPLKRAHWEAHLAEHAALVRSLGLPADFVVCGGIASDSILVCAMRQQCDLILMGTRGQRDLSQARFGSVAEAVMRQTTCPVLTVRNPSSFSHRLTTERNYS